MTQASAARLVAAAAIGGAVLGVVSNLLFGLALGFDISELSAAPRYSSVPPERAGLVRWGALTDMLGYYLPTIPVAIYLRRRLTGWNGFTADLATAGGLAYAVIGSLGAAALATTVPSLLRDGSEAAAALLEALTDLVVVGWWQTLQPIPFAVWMLGIAAALPVHRRGLALFTRVLAGAAAITVLGRILAAEVIALVGVTVWVVPFPVWLLAVGLMIRHGDSGKMA